MTIRIEELVPGEYYWIAAPNLYDHIEYEVDKFEFVKVQSAVVGIFKYPKNWRINKELSNYCNRGKEKMMFIYSYVFKTKKEALKYAYDWNWALAQRLSRKANLQEIEYSKAKD